MKCQIWVIALPAFLLLAGCASGKSRNAGETAGSRPEMLQEMDRLKMRETARKQGEIMLTAMQKRDYAGFTQFFPPEIRARFPKTEFDKFESYIGRLQKWEYLTEMKTPMLTEYLWKTTVLRKDAQGAEMQIDMLFHISAVKQNGQYRIVGSWFR